MDFLGLLEDLIKIIVVAESVTKHIIGKKTEDCTESLEEISGSQN